VGLTQFPNNDFQDSFPGHTGLYDHTILQLLGLISWGSKTFTFILYTMLYFAFTIVHPHFSYSAARGDLLNNWTHSELHRVKSFGLFPLPYFTRFLRYPYGYSSLIIRRAKPVFSVTENKYSHSNQYPVNPLLILKLFTPFLEIHKYSVSLKFIFIANTLR
jgi:hypothetical protein